MHLVRQCGHLHPTYINYRLVSCNICWPTVPKNMETLKRATWLTKVILFNAFTCLLRRIIPLLKERPLCDPFSILLRPLVVSLFECNTILSSTFMSKHHSKIIYLSVFGAVWSIYFQWAGHSIGDNEAFSRVVRQLKLLAVAEKKYALLSVIRVV